MKEKARLGAVTDWRRLRRCEEKSVQCGLLDQVLDQSKGVSGATDEI